MALGGRGFKTPKDQPCPTCFSPMKKTKEGFECLKHGIPKQVPYKEKSNKNANTRINRAAQARDKWDKMGLDILEEERILICLTCRKETKFFASDLFRHENDCPMRAVSLRLVGKTEEQTKWSRRNGHKRSA